MHHKGGLHLVSEHFLLINLEKSSANLNLELIRIKKTKKQHFTQHCLSSVIWELALGGHFKTFLTFIFWMKRFLVTNLWGFFFIELKKKAQCCFLS